MLPKWSFFISSYSMLKSKLPPSRKTCLISLEMSLDRNETCLVFRECTGSTNNWHYCFVYGWLYNVHIILISTLDMISIFISTMCVPCVSYKNLFLHLQADNFLQLLAVCLHLRKMQELICG